MENKQCSLENTIFLVFENFSSLAAKDNLLHQHAAGFSFNWRTYRFFHVAN